MDLSEAWSSSIESRSEAWSSMVDEPKGFRDASSARLRPTTTRPALLLELSASLLVQVQAVSHGRVQVVLARMDLAK